MTGSNDKDSLDTFFREAFEQLPDTPSPSGWDKPSDTVWSRIQMDVAKASTPPQSRFGRLWFVGAAALVTVLALFWLAKQTEDIAPAAQQAHAVEKPATPQGAEDFAAVESTSELQNEQMAKPVLKRTQAPETSVQSAPETQSIALNTEQKPEGYAPALTSTGSVPNEEPKESLEEKTKVETPNTLEKLSLQITDNQNLAPEVKPQQRFPNNLDRIKAERNEEGQTARSVSPLQPLPQKPIPMSIRSMSAPRNK